MDDTTRTALTGLGSSAIVGLGILPDLVSVAVGIVTIIYVGEQYGTSISVGNEKYPH